MSLRCVATVLKPSLPDPGFPDCGAIDSEPFDTLRANGQGIEFVIDRGSVEQLQSVERQTFGDGGELLAGADRRIGEFLFEDSTDRRDER